MLDWISSLSTEAIVRTVVSLVVVVLAGTALVYRHTLEEWLPHQALDPEVFLEYPLVEKTELSPNSAIYKFKLDGPSDTLRLPIGKHISVAANIDGKQVIRSYTPISSEADKGHFRLLIKSYDLGNVSKYVAQLKIGDKIKIRGPKGQFAYRPNMVRALGMVAGGSGITPMYQITKAIASNRKDRTEVHLVFANVTEKDILLRDELEALAATHPNIHIYHVLNNPPENWKGGVGFVTTDILREHVPSPAPDVKLLICGPPPMVRAIKKAAEELGFDKARPVSKLEDQVFAF